MSVWYCIPSARPVAEANVCLHKWRELGYGVAVHRDPEKVGEPEVDADLVLYRPYTGYAESVNWLCKIVLKDPSISIIVTGGDDIDPDPRRDPKELEAKFFKNFNGTFGVMQPTGDRWMIENGKSSEERVCSSPWIGREFCERMYGGQGPLWPGWLHFFVDQELHEVALKLGVLRHAKDICQYHHHWMREGGKRPPHLSEARLDWSSARALFEQRAAAGFPGHEPLLKSVLSAGFDLEQTV